MEELPATASPPASNFLASAGPLGHARTAVRGRAPARLFLSRDRARGEPRGPGLRAPWQPGAGRRALRADRPYGQLRLSLTTATSTIATSSSRSPTARLPPRLAPLSLPRRVPPHDHVRRSAGRQPVSFPMTVHGPVFGTATVGGRPYAITWLRSTYGEDALSMAALRDMDARSRPDDRRVLQLGQPVRLHVQLGLKQPPPHRLSPRASSRTGRRDEQAAADAGHR